jgi:hypothetical protein
MCNREEALKMEIYKNSDWSILISELKMNPSPSLVQTVYTAEGTRLLIHLLSNAEVAWIIDDEGRVYTSSILDRDKLASISKVIAGASASIISEADGTLTITFSSITTVKAKLDPSLDAANLLTSSFHDLLASNRIILDEGAAQVKPSVQYVYVNTEKIEERKRKTMRPSASLTSARTGIVNCIYMIVMKPARGVEFESDED